MAPVREPDGARNDSIGLCDLDSWRPLPGTLRELPIDDSISSHTLRKAAFGGLQKSRRILWQFRERGGNRQAQALWPRYHGQTFTRRDQDLHGKGVRRKGF